MEKKLLRQRCNQPGRGAFVVPKRRPVSGGVGILILSQLSRVEVKKKKLDTFPDKSGARQNPRMRKGKGEL